MPGRDSNPWPLWSGVVLYWLSFQAYVINSNKGFGGNWGSEIFNSNGRQWSTDKQHLRPRPQWCVRKKFSLILFLSQYIALCQKISTLLPWKCFSSSSRSPPLWILKHDKLPTFLWNFCLLDPSPSFLEFSINLSWGGYGCLLELYILATVRHCLDQSFPC